MLNFFKTFNQLNSLFSVEIQYAEFRELEESDIETAQEFAEHWATQKDRADRYTQLMAAGTMNKAQAHAYFIERLSPLPHRVEAQLGQSRAKALGEARKYSKQLREAR